MKVQWQNPQDCSWAETGQAFRGIQVKQLPRKVWDEGRAHENAGKQKHIADTRRA